MKSELMDLKNIDYEILSLFPSLDFTRAGINNQSKQGMQRNLAILYLAAKNGKVTKYKLTDERSKIRMGGQSAQLGLERLVEIGLLKNEKTINEKGTLRIDRKLTPKGIIACLVFLEFQKKDILDKILEQFGKKENQLVFMIELYNATFVRGVLVDDSSLSPLTTLVKIMSQQKYNIELKTNMELAEDLSRIEDDNFLKSLHGDPSDIMNSFIIGLSKHDENTRKTVMDLFKKNTEKYAELVSGIDAESKDDLNKDYMQLSKKLTNNLMLFITSPELVTFLKKMKGSSELTKLFEEAQKRIGISEMKYENPIDQIVYYFQIMRRILREKMFSR